MSIIDEDIKSGKLNHIYLIYGAESFLRKQYKERLKKALAPDDDTMNYSYFEGKDISAGEVIDLAETMPFLSDKRAIILENSPFFKSEGEKIAEYLNTVPDTTYLVFVEEGVDKRSKLYKSIAKNGCVVEAASLSEDKIITWILGILKKDNKKITQNTMHYLLGKIGTDMENIRQEVEKLICYCYDRDVITNEDIDAVCTTQISNQIFEMLDAMANKRQKVALQLYYNLLALKEPPMRILFLIGRQFNLLLQARLLKQKGYGDRAIAEKIGVPPFAATKYLNQASKFKMADLRQAVDECVEADEAVKSGNRNDRLSVELLIIKYSN
ncbi:MAG: DNA polymerase III subunit delta [Lachnospiraceae bacterium]|nr:DNA polymerase III subunit delta [Lachnospiraceae bacterium]